MLSDRAASAHVHRSAREPRPQNYRANHTVPTASELASFRRQTRPWGSCARLKRRITGAFTGTTDEILQWGAWKWGLDPNLLRAVAVKESNWRGDALGDGGESFGLMQVKRTAHPGTHPLSQRSDAFNVDYYGAYVRLYLAGCAYWLRRGGGSVPYQAGDLEGSIGAWYSGRWHENTDDYLSAVRHDLAERPWAKPTF